MIILSYIIIEVCLDTTEHMKGRPINPPPPPKPHNIPVSPTYSERVAKTISPNDLASIPKRYEIHVHNLNTHRRYSFIKDKIHGFKIVPYFSTTLWTISKGVTRDEYRQYKKLKIHDLQMTKQFRMDANNKLIASHKPSPRSRDLIFQLIPGTNKFFLYYIVEDRKRLYLTVQQPDRDTINIIGKKLVNKKEYPAEFEIFERIDKRN